MPYIWKDTDHEQPLNRGFTKNGTQYPRNWLNLASDEEKEAIGIEWVDDGRPRENESYYYIRGRRGDWTVEPRPLDGLKEKAVAATKKSAGTRLASSDWMAVRAAEGGAAVPEDWAAYRTAVREYSNSYEVAIGEATFDSIQNMRAEWPESPAEKEQREKMEAEAKAAEEERKR